MYTPAPIKPNPKPRDHVAEHCADKGPAAYSDGAAEHVALDVVLGFDHLALIDLYVPPFLSFPVTG